MLYKSNRPEQYYLLRNTDDGCVYIVRMYIYCSVFIMQAIQHLLKVSTYKTSAI